jgi:two-component system, response regulator, stage 0 sporulation protein F
MLQRKTKPKHLRGGSPLRVYLAEDDPALRSTIAGLLRSDGHDVVEAEDGIQLMVDLASGGRRDDIIVVADVRMPMVGGLAVLRSLYRTGRLPPFILMSGFATEGLRAEALLLGAMAVFDKPFDIDDLRRLVLSLAGGPRPMRRDGRFWH